jgi:hypothetical protein
MHAAKGNTQSPKASAAGLRRRNFDRGPRRRNHRARALLKLEDDLPEMRAALQILERLPRLLKGKHLVNHVFQFVNRIARFRCSNISSEPTKMRANEPTSSARGRDPVRFRPPGRQSRKPRRRGAQRSTISAWFPLPYLNHMVDTDPVSEAKTPPGPNQEFSCSSPHRPPPISAPGQFSRRCST